LTPQHQPSLIKEIEELAHSLRCLNNQLFVQSLVLSELLANTLQMATMYYAQVAPKELRRFDWHIDAKDEKLTNYEKYWKSTLLPFLQSRSFEAPFISVDEFNYSFFNKFQFTLPAPPKHLLPHLKPRERKEFHGIDIKKIFQLLAFDQSKSNLGIQLVDIIANTFRRALRENLRREGWEELGSLIFMKPKGKVIPFLGLNTSSQLMAGNGVTRVPYFRVLEIIQSKAKHIIQD
jgi:hypothetical protein